MTLAACVAGCGDDRVATPQQHQAAIRQQLESGDTQQRLAALHIITGEGVLPADCTGLILEMVQYDKDVDIRRQAAGALYYYRGAEHTRVINGIVSCQYLETDQEVKQRLTRAYQEIEKRQSALERQ